MAQKLTLEYDRIGDILYVQACPPYREQECDELAQEMLGRFNPDTGALEGLEIQFFTKRFRRRRELLLPFAVEMNQYLPQGDLLRLSESQLVGLNW